MRMQFLKNNRLTPKIGSVNLRALRLQLRAGLRLRLVTSQRQLITKFPRRGAGAVERGALEMRCAGNPCTQGSNPCPSAIKIKRLIFNNL